jgi:hypothetical protein
MNDEYNFLSKPLTTSAFIQGMNFQPSGMEYQAPAYDVLKGTALGNFASDNSYSTVPALNSDALTTLPILNQRKSLYQESIPDGSNVMPRDTETSSIFGDASKLQGISSLVSAGAGLANTLAMLPILKEQRRSLEQNRKFAAEDQLARRTARSGFNSFKG